MWNGAVVCGDDWMAYHGATDQNSRHAHSAAQLAFGLDGPVSIVHAGGTVQADALFIAPGAALVNESCNSVSLMLFPLFATLALWPAGWPLCAQLGVAIIVTDMAITLTHFFSHRHALLWRFHAVHHSIERLYGFNGLMNIRCTRRLS